MKLSHQQKEAMTWSIAMHRQYLRCQPCDAHKFRTWASLERRGLVRLAWCKRDGKRCENYVPTTAGRALARGFPTPKRRVDARPGCPGCGELMVGRRTRLTAPVKYGYLGEGKFCSLRCGYAFAVQALDILTDAKHRSPERTAKDLRGLLE